MQLSDAGGTCCHVQAVNVLQSKFHEHGHKVEAREIFYNKRSSALTTLHPETCVSSPVSEVSLSSHLPYQRCY